MMKILLDTYSENSSFSKAISGQVSTHSNIGLDTFSNTANIPNKLLSKLLISLCHQADIIRHYS